MYSSVEELCGNSGVEKCVFANFTSKLAINLITALEDQLKIYQIQNDSSLKLLWEEKLFGKVSDLLRIPSEPDLLFVTLKDAKAVLLHWSPESEEPLPLSIHFFERDDLQTEHLVNHYPPLASLDPLNRCIAMRIYKDSIAFIPVKEDKNDAHDNEEVYQSFTNSFVVPLSNINKRIKNLIRFSFLPGYVQPTIAFLYEPELTFVGRYSIKKDPCEVLVASVDLAQKTFTFLYSVENLPIGCSEFLPLSKPIGGILLGFPEGIIHIDQGYSGYGISVNEYAARSSSTAFRFKKDSSPLQLDLSNAKFISISPYIVGCFLENGSIYYLNLNQDGKRFVSGMELISASYEGPFFIPTVVDYFDNFLFIGSRLSDSVLAKLIRSDKLNENQQKMSNSFSSCNSVDDIDAELFGTSVIPSAISTNQSLLSVATIPTYGPIRDCTVGLVKKSGKIYEQAYNTEMLTAIGKDSSGAVCIWESCVKPTVRVSFPFPSCCNIWSFPSPDSDSDRYLMLSTTNSTLIMELIDDEFNELPVSEFYLEGVTLFASTILDDSVIVQVYNDGFRCLSNDTKKSLIYKYSIESVFQIIAATTINGQYLFLLFENGSSKAFNLSCIENTENSMEVDFSSDKNVLSNKIFEIYPLDCGKLINGHGEICCFCELFFDWESYLVIFTANGSLLIFNIDRGEIVFQDNLFYLLPKISRFNNNPNDKSSSEFRNVVEVKSVFVENSGSFILLKNDFAQTISYKVNLTSKILIKQKASFYKNCAFSHSPGFNSIVPLRLNDGSTFKSAAISIGKTQSSLWSVSAETSYPRCFSLLNNNITILCATSHNSQLVKNGFIFITSDGLLNIACCDPSFSYDCQLPNKKMHLGKDVCFVDYNLTSRKYIFASGIKKHYIVPPFETAPASDSPSEAQEQSQQLVDKFLPAFDKFSLDLYSQTPFDKIDSFTLKEYEIVTGCKSIVLDSRRSSSGKKEFLIVSTSYLKGEDRQIRGRFMLFEVISIVPDSNFPHRDHRLKIILSSEQKGPVTSFSQVNGYLLMAIGSKILMFVFDEKDDESMEAIAFLDMKIYSTCIASFKNYFWIGDVYKSGAFCVWQEEPPKLILLGQDGHELPVTCVELMASGQLLYLVAGDAFGNIHIFSYSPSNLSSNAGTKLVKRGQFHVGSRLVKFIRFSPHSSSTGATEGLLYFCQDGCFGLVLPFNEKPFKRIQSVFTKFTNSSIMPFALNPRSHRLAAQDQSLTFVHNFVTKSILDCELIKHFCSISRNQQREIAHYIGTNVAKLFKDFEKYSTQSNKI